MNNCPNSYFRNSSTLSLNVKTTDRANSPSPGPLESETKPLIRACGCAHRFLPTNTGTESTSYRRRSRSCMPVQRIWKKTDTISSGGCKLNAKNQQRKQSLTRHTSENNLRGNKRVIEIREVFEFIPHCRCDSSESRAIPCKYITTLYVDLNSSIKRYVEEISFQVCDVSPQSADATSFKQTYSGQVKTTIKQTHPVGNSATMTS